MKPDKACCASFARAIVADDWRTGGTRTQPHKRTDPRRGEGRERPRCEIRRKPKLTRQQIAHARKLIDDGQRREDVAALLNVDRTTLYRALAG
jgi:DNA invertase Pin-like site-specific DNA recombinase